MDEYLNLIHIFFDEKLMFLTEEKQRSCPDCTDKKQFIEKSAPVDIEGGRGEIILSCGDTKSDKSKCGNKIRIILPIYSSNKDLNFLKNKLNQMINWDIIKEFIDVDPKLIQENKEITEKYNEEFEKLKELFNKYNNDNLKKIRENYEEIIELKSLQKTKLSELKNPENKSKVKELKTEYIVISGKITLLFREIKELDIQDYYRTTEPEIAVKNLDFRVKQKAKPVKKSKRKMPLDLAILWVMYDFNELKTVSMEEIYGYIPEIQKYTGKVGGDPNNINDLVTIKDGIYNKIRRPIKQGESMISNGLIDWARKPKENYFKIIEKGEKYLDKNRGKYIKTDEGTSIEKSDKKVIPEKTSKDRIKEGSNVSWTKDGKDFNGIVEKINNKTYKICCKPGKKSGDKGSTYMIKKDLVKLN